MLAWNEHGPRSEPGPVASLAFWKQTLRTVLRAAPRSRVLMGVPTWGWRWNATAGAGAEQATQAQLFPEATEQALQRPYGARVGKNAWVESDRSVQLKLLVARQARSRAWRSVGARRGVLRAGSQPCEALQPARRDSWHRQEHRARCGSPFHRVAALVPTAFAVAGRVLECRERVVSARRDVRLAPAPAAGDHDGAAHEAARDDAARAPQARAPAGHETRR